ncbi:MAG TPA: family 2A encapsulin nanocompartment shell protein [Bacillota bacterium]|nr:family 2A encapsulin nanocompartment shell protein [Bacillota bacterium]
MNIEAHMIQSSLNPAAARALSHPTISVLMFEEVSPRWLLAFLPWVPVEAGVYRVNRLKKCGPEPRDYPATSLGEPTSSPYLNNSCNEYGEKSIDLFSCHEGEPDLPQTFPDYEDKPREYPLSLIQTMLKINTRVSDIYNAPINQLQEQMRLTVEAMLERQESELINNREFGLVNSVAPEMRISTRNGAPTPDDLDSLLARVWKKPAFFLAHPQAIAAFGRECTRRGVPPATANLYGSPFITWRGVPLVPSDKIRVNGRSKADLCCSGTTQILLLRVGEAEQGVIGLHQPGIPDEKSHPSLSVKFAGIDNKGISHYLLNLYFSAVVLTADALAILDNVEVGSYHEYV